LTRQRLAAGGKMLVGAALIATVFVTVLASDPWAKYHDQANLEQTLIEVNAKCPEQTRLYTIGQSVQGRELLVIEFSSRPGQHKLRKTTTVVLVGVR
jgi:hypothetical protein